MAKRYGLEIIYCPFPLKKQIHCKRKPYISPESWLWYVENAEYVITDAFHGTVFSIIFNKEFYSEISNYGSDTSSRITGILEVFNLEDRLLNKSNFKESNKKINYNEVNNKICKERECSVEYLKAMID